MKERINLINPECRVDTAEAFFSAENWSSLLTPDLDYVADAIDTVISKLLLVEKSLALSLPLVSSMGAGNRLDPSLLRVADISATTTDPLARIMRRELRKRGIEKGVKVVFSAELPLKPQRTPPNGIIEEVKNRQPPGSSAFVPPAAGLLMASTIVRDLLSR